MSNALMKSVAVAAVTAFAAMTLPAAATTVSLTYTGATAGGTAKIDAAPVAPVGGLITYGAWGFKMTDSAPGGLGNFVAWCLDISHWLGSGPQSYDTTTNPFTNSYPLGAAGVARVQAVFDANYAAVTANVTNDTQAAFQIALWDAVYDDDFDAGTGDFRVTSSALATANIYLDAAEGYIGGAKVWDLTFFQGSPTNNPVVQNLVAATPVPVPAAAGLLLAALGGLGLLRRRRRPI